MAAARKKKSEPQTPLAEFTLGDVSVTVPVEVQAREDRTEAGARRLLHEIADRGEFELHIPAKAEPQAEEPAEE